MSFADTSPAVSPPAPNCCESHTTGVASVPSNNCVCVSLSAQSPSAADVSESSQVTAYRGRMDVADRRRLAEGSQLLAPPTSATAGRAPSPSSSRTRSQSVSPPLERQPLRIGRRYRALGEGGQGARARSLSPNPGQRVHRRARTPQAYSCRILQAQDGEEPLIAKHSGAARGN